MKGHEAVMRLAAFAQGKPLPHGETLHVPKSGKGVQPAEIMVVAFVRMGGESAPWGVAFGPPDGKPTVLSVAEPRTPAVARAAVRPALAAVRRAVVVIAARAQQQRRARGSEHPPALTTTHVRFPP